MYWILTDAPVGKRLKYRNYSGGMLDRDLCHEMSVSDCQGVKRKTSSV
jgi:hypothetical protein